MKKVILSSATKCDSTEQMCTVLPAFCVLSTFMYINLNTIKTFMWVWQIYFIDKFKIVENKII